MEVEPFQTDQVRASAKDRFVDAWRAASRPSWKSAGRLPRVRAGGPEFEIEGLPVPAAGAGPTAQEPEVSLPAPVSAAAGAGVVPRAWARASASHMA